MMDMYPIDQNNMQTDQPLNLAIMHAQVAKELLGILRASLKSKASMRIHAHSYVYKQKCIYTHACISITSQPEYTHAHIYTHTHMHASIYIYIPYEYTHALPQYRQAHISPNFHADTSTHTIVRLPKYFNRQKHTHRLQREQALFPGQHPCGRIVQLPSKSSTLLAYVLP